MRSEVKSRCAVNFSLQEDKIEKMSETVTIPLLSTIGIAPTIIMIIIIINIVIIIIIIIIERA